MLEKVLKLYTMGMLYDTRSPMPHLFGPPGVGKSTVVQQAADLLGVKLHIINVSRISPLELEGVQMPVDNNTRLELLLATLWSNLQEGDIVLLDEFLRGFPEVYNGLLDILTSRQVANHMLPKVFFIAASNSTATYDGALEDRLLHIPVADIRKSLPARNRLKKLLISAMGLHDSLIDSQELNDLVEFEIAPTYDVLDSLKGTHGSGTLKGQSARKLIGQLQMRQVSSAKLKELITVHNSLCQDRIHKLIVIDPQKHLKILPQLTELVNDSVAMAKLYDVERLNTLANVQLLELQQFKQHSLNQTESEQYDIHDPEE